MTIVFVMFVLVMMMSLRMLRPALLITFLLYLRGFGSAAVVVSFIGSGVQAVLSVLLLMLVFLFAGRNSVTPVLLGESVE